MKRVSKVLRKVAHVVGALMLLLVLMVLAGDLARDGMIDPQTLSVFETMEFVALGFILLGLLLAYWREFYGGLMIVLGYFAFAFIEYIDGGRLLVSWVFITFLLVGMIYLMCAWVDVDEAAPA